jgi:hypothetical protein
MFEGSNITNKLRIGYVLREAPDVPSPHQIYVTTVSDECLNATTLPRAFGVR